MQTEERVSPLHVPCMEILQKYGYEKHSVWNTLKTCTLIEKKILKLSKMNILNFTGERFRRSSSEWPL
jgi:hypothetical protein